MQVRSMKVHVLHENEARMPPFHAAFKDLDLPFEEWHLADGTFDISAPPPKGIFFNRMSASAHMRGHDFTPELTASILAWLEAYGARSTAAMHSTSR